MPRSYIKNWYHMYSMEVKRAIWNILIPLYMNNFIVWISLKIIVPKAHAKHDTIVREIAIIIPTDKTIKASNLSWIFNPGDLALWILDAGPGLSTFWSSSGSSISILNSGISPLFPSWLPIITNKWFKEDIENKWTAC